MNARIIGEKKMSKSQRDKGARIEREIIAMINSTLNTDATRNLSQSRDGGYDTLFAIKEKEFMVEIKARASHGCVRHLEQVEKVGSSAIKLAILKEDRNSACVLLRLSDFLDLLKEQHD